MKTNPRRFIAFVFCSLALSFTTAPAQGRDPSVGELLVQNAATAGVAITPEEARAMEKANGLERIICASIYPAPSSNLECVKEMAKEIEKQFPDAEENARGRGLMEVPSSLAQSPLSAEVFRLNARILGACLGNDFGKCMDKVYRALLSAFDPHSGYMTPEEFAEMRDSSAPSFSGIGLEVGGLRKKGDPMTALNPMEGSPAERAGILPGDVIVGISKDGTDSAMRLIESYETLTEAVKDIRGVKGTKVLLLIERPGESQKRTFTIVRGVIDAQTVKHTLLSDGKKRYGVIHVRQFDEQVCRKTEEAYKKLSAAAGRKLDGLIVSVERDPGGLLTEAHCLVDLFVDAESFVLQKDRRSIAPFLPCRRNIFGGESCMGGIKSYPGDITAGLPMLVMVNGGSASASEIFAMGMKLHGRAVIAGTPTFGKGSVQTIMPLDDGGALKMTSAEYLVGTRVDWVPVQCLGVVPDIVFDRGLDPKDKDGKRITECGLDHSIRSGGPMPNPPRHDPIEVANPARYARGVEMLEAYKKHVAPEDAKLKKQQELFKKMLEDEEKKKQRK